MKKNFTDSEIAFLKLMLGSKLNVSINRAGNIKVINPNEPEHRSYWGCTSHKFWVLYHNNMGYLWRRHDGCGYCYPLNIRPFDIKNSYFNSLNEALEYFVNYLKKYHNINF